MHAMNHKQILAATVARRAATYRDVQRREAHARLVAALRTIPPELRASEAEAAIKRLAKQEALEAKLKALSDEDLDKVQIG
jgi:hypothetical protein